MANTVLAKMAVQIAANTADFNSALSKTQKDLSSFSKNITSMAVGLAAAFSIKEVASFGLEISKLAAEAEGVESAFRKIQNSSALLNQLQQATEGTVADLKLMKLAVSAVNNGAPLNDLAEILNFLDRTADSTGKNFEELADTVIKNIGKESVKGLNELGLNLEKIKTSSDKIGFLPSLMEEIRRKSDELGDISSKTADSYDRQVAAIDNLKTSWGALINSAGVSAFLDKIASVFDLLSGKKVTLSKEQIDKAAVSLNKLREEAKASGNQEDVVRLTKLIAQLASGYMVLKDKAIDPVTQSINHNTVAVKKLADEYDRLDSITRKKFLAPLEVGDRPTASGKIVDPSALSVPSVKSMVDGLKTLPVQAKPIILEMQELFGDLSSAAMAAGDIIGNSLEGAFSGAFSGVQLLARATSQIVDLFARQAIAAAIANAAKVGGPFPFAAVALASAAAGAMKGLLSRVGVGGRFGGGGSGGSFSPSGTYASSLALPNGDRIPTLMLEARGTSLISVTYEQSRRDGRIRANSRKLG